MVFLYSGCKKCSVPQRHEYGIEFGYIIADTEDEAQRMLYRKKAWDFSDGRDVKLIKVDGIAPAIVEVGSYYE